MTFRRNSTNVSPLKTVHRTTEDGRTTFTYIPCVRKRRIYDPSSLLSAWLLNACTGISFIASQVESLNTRQTKSMRTTNPRVATHHALRQPPFYAWDDPKGECPGLHGVSATAAAEETTAVVNEAPSLEGDKGKTSHVRRRRENHKINRSNQSHQPSFYDREALQEQLQGHETQRSNLYEQEAQLKLRLNKAHMTLSAMRVKKRDLSENKMLDEAASVVLPSKGKVRAAGAFRERKDRHNSNGGSCSRLETRKQQREEGANVRKVFSP